jgi:AcrR family transcriptional regulator
MEASETANSNGRPGLALAALLTQGGRAPQQLEDEAALPDTRKRLLIAAERLIYKGGCEAATSRRIAAEAKAHVGQVAYYFGSLPGLFRTLADDNLDLVLGGRTQLLAHAQQHVADPLGGLLDAYLRPMFFAAVHSRDMPTGGIVRELISHSEGTQREEIIRRINENVQLSHQCLAPHLPGLDAWELHLRLRLITGAAVYLMPTIDELGLFDFGLGVPAGRDTYQQLLVAARAVMVA